MANFNYGSYPYGNIYQPQQPNYAQPNFNNNLGNMMNNQPQQTQMTQCYWVNGSEGAKAFQMIPNQTAMLMDSENPIMYMKQTNSMGQGTIKYYKLIEITEQDIKNQNAPQQNTQPNPEYVLKADFDVLSKRIDELSRKIEKPYKSQINSEKGGKE